MKSLMLVVLLCCAAAQAQTPSSYASFSRTFRCPEDLPDDQAREQSLRDFLAWVQQGVPDPTVEKLVLLRVRLLEEHRCEKTLANMRRSEAD